MSSSWEKSCPGSEIRSIELERRCMLRSGRKRRRADDDDDDDDDDSSLRVR